MKIFVGYESAYPEMFEVCKASILRFNPTHEVIPLITSELEEQGIYTRKEKGNTEFAFTRFLVPYLSNYMGYSLFCDGDFLWRCDPQEITHFKKDNEEVMCVQHADLMFDQYTKMHDKLNKPYDKKYWSSLMYFNKAYHTHTLLLSVSLRRAQHQQQDPGSQDALLMPRSPCPMPMPMPGRRNAAASSS